MINIGTIASSVIYPPIPVEYLVIAGGGGGQNSPYGGGGGGAGGALYNANKSVQRGLQYGVTIGAGGASHGSGVDSFFGAARTYGGGTGASGVGGCGGGGGHSGVSGQYGLANQTSNDGGTGYGNNGGTNTYGNPYPCGGGGGAGGVGGNNGGTGGPGRAFSISGATTYAGGGGTCNNSGGTSAGGGSGAGNGTDGGNSNAAANTGSGGGGGRNTASVNGGSGIVIIRYADTYPAASTTGATITVAGGYRVYTWTSSGTITF